MYTFNKEIDRGQVGIGTLIVFIAMVLVAAIAAGVLVNTADMLQESAEQTGEDSQAQVSDRLQVIDVYGNVDKMGTSNDPSDATSGYSNDDWQYVEGETSTMAESGEPVVHELGFLVMRAAGANDINIETVTVSWQGPDGAEQVVLNPDNNQRFEVEKVAGEDKSNNLLESTSDRAMIRLRLGQYVEDSSSSDGFTDSNFKFLTAGEEVTIKFNTEAGATVTKQIRIPSLIQDEETIEL